MSYEGSSSIPYDLLMKIQQGTMTYRYRGIPMQKNPFDLALYPLLMERVRPRTLIEIGSFAGGSALWFADQGRQLGLDLRVYSVALQEPVGVPPPPGTSLPGEPPALPTPPHPPSPPADDAP